MLEQTCGATPFMILNFLPLEGTGTAVAVTPFNLLVYELVCVRGLGKPSHTTAPQGMYVFKRT